jgi:ELWxxDGT repeat protein
MKLRIALSISLFATTSLFGSTGAIALPNDERPKFAQQLTPAGNNLFFVARNEQHGWGLWVSNGTVAGSRFVKALPPDGTANDYVEAPFDLHAVGSTLYFVGYDGQQGHNLWKSNGSSAGTQIVANFAPPAEDEEQPDWYGLQGDLVDMNGDVYFATFHKEDGDSLWVTDGTQGGTELLVEGTPGASSSEPVSLGGNPVLGDTLYFGRNGDLWKTDGSPEGTSEVKELPSGTNSPGDVLSITPPQPIGGKLLFQVDVGDRGGTTQLWKSDGSQNGTELIEAINTPNENFWTPVLFPRGDEAFFAAADVAHGLELWKTDGTADGTAMVEDADVDTKGKGWSTFEMGNQPFVSRFAGATVMGDHVYYPGRDAGHGWELWRSDGTTQGTRRVADIKPGSLGSKPLAFATLGSNVYFYARDGKNGLELWKSDGTAAGTKIARNVNPQGNGAFDFSAQAVAMSGRVYFLAQDGTHPTEVWKTNGVVTRRLLGPWE